MASFSLSVQAYTSWDSDDRDLNKALRLETRTKQDIPNRGEINLRDRSSLVVVKAPEYTDSDPPPCTLSLDIIPTGSDLGLHRLEIVSEARNIEIYDDGDVYIGTAKGYSQRDGEEVSMHICSYTFSSLAVTSEVVIKFLSLRGKLKFCLKEIVLTFDVLRPDEDSKQLFEQTVFPHPADPDVLDKVGNLPKELQAVVSTLHHLKSERSGAPTLPQDSAFPGEMVMAMAMLKNMHSVLHKQDKIKSSSDSSSQAVQDPLVSEVQTEASPDSPNSDGFATREDLLNLQRHFDDAIHSLQKQIDDKFDQVLKILSEKL